MYLINFMSLKYERKKEVSVVDRSTHVSSNMGGGIITDDGILGANNI